MREIEYIVVHCADTYADMNIGVEQIRKWHLKRGWNDVGYHYVIRRNGQIELGRLEDTIGAHVSEHNAKSIGVCMVGGKARGDENPTNFTSAQWDSLYDTVTDLVARYPGAKVVGHCDLDDKKTCPTFDVPAWWSKR